MCCSRIKNRKINCLHVAGNDLSGQTIVIWTEIKERQFRFSSSEKSLSPILIQELFMPNNEHTYSWWHLRQFKTPWVNTVYHGIESASFLGPNISVILPDSFKKIDNIDNFKKAIKWWKPSNCPWRLCRVYVQNVGFLKSLLNYNDEEHLKC